MPHTSKLPDINIPNDISFPEFMMQNLLKYPYRKLLIDPSTNSSFTCKQAFETINQISAGLHQKGLKQGEVVALILPNMTLYPLIIFGIQNLGAIATTLNPMQTPDEMAYQMNISHSSFMITTPQFTDKVNEALQQVKSKMKEIIVVGEDSFDAVLKNNGQFPRPKFDPRTTVALLPFSSGTTGFPKGVELTHYNMIANSLQTLTMQVGMWGESETILSFVPLFHVYGIVQVTGVTFRRCYTLVLMPRFDLQQFLEYIQTYQATVLPIVPPVAVLLAKDPTVQNYDMRSARVIFCGAAPLGPEIDTILRTRFPGVFLIQGYGLTETAPSTHSANVFTNLPGAVGQLYPNMTIKIVDENGQEVELGQRGEIWVKGPNVMKGYLNNPEATNNTIDREGYLHTGDIGYMDKNLNLYIVDRLKELIKYKGFQVAPAELEALLLTHSDVADVAVVGKPDESAGELPVAFVVLKKDHKVTEQEIVEWAANKTSAHKKLRGGVVFVDVIPKSPSGKILRKIVRAKL